MDRVFIEGLRVEATIGIFDWEQRILQPLEIDLEMAWDNRPAATSGAIEEALDYAAVSEAVTGLIQSKPWGLIEEVAEAIGRLIQKEFKVQGVTLKVAKPTAVLTAKTVAVQITRGSFN